MSSLRVAKLMGRKMLVKSYLRLLQWLGRRSVAVTLQSGCQLKVRLNDQLARQILSDQAFEHSVLKRIRSSVQDGMVVLDVGANIGYYTVQFAAWVGPTGQVIAFEPNPAMLAELERNVRLNGLRNVIIKPVALSNRAGEVEFHCPPAGHEGHGSFHPNETFATASTIKVPTRRLDDVLADLGIDAADFIKIDVEGAERSIFQGATKLLTGSRKPTMIFECAEITCHAFGHCVLDVLREIADRGYQLEEIDYSMWYARPI